MVRSSESDVSIPCRNELGLDLLMPSVVLMTLSDIFPSMSPAQASIITSPVTSLALCHWTKSCISITD